MFFSNSLDKIKAVLARVLRPKSGVHNEIRLEVDIRSLELAEVDLHCGSTRNYHGIQEKSKEDGATWSCNEQWEACHERKAQSWTQSSFCVEELPILLNISS